MIQGICLRTGVERPSITSRPIFQQKGARDGDLPTTGASRRLSAAMRGFRRNSWAEVGGMSKANELRRHGQDFFSFVGFSVNGPSPLHPRIKFLGAPCLTLHPRPRAPPPSLSAMLGASRHSPWRTNGRRPRSYQRRPRVMSDGCQPGRNHPRHLGNEPWSSWTRRILLLSVELLAS